MRNQILLYYKYVKVADPAAIRAWQQQLCEELELKGRVIIAAEGINGTVCGRYKNTRQYMKALTEHDLFSDIEFKVAATDGQVFPRLSIKVRPEIVTLAKEKDLTKTAVRLSPQTWHEMAQREDVVIIDARNKYESAIGQFKGAITPNIQNFKELPEAIDHYKDELQGKKILAYCTGGVRCEPFTAYLKDQGYENVYQLEGGIIKYGEEFPDGLFEGKCFVFDKRMSIAFKNEPEVLGECIHCQAKADQYYNCALPECNKLVLVCGNCRERTSFCQKTCALENVLA